MFGTITTTALDTVGSTSTDVIGLVLLCIALLTWGRIKGRSVLIALLFALYPAMLITTHLPYTQIPSITGAPGRLVVFALSLAVGFIALRRYLTHTFFFGGLYRWFELGILSVVLAGVTGVALYHHVDIGTLYTFSNLFDQLFLSPVAHIAWLAAGLLVTPLFVRGS
jgi:hypothetical protein